MNLNLRQQFTLRMFRKDKDTIPIDIQHELDHYADRYAYDWLKDVEEHYIRWTGHAHPLFIAMNVAIIKGDMREYRRAKEWLLDLELEEKDELN